MASASQASTSTVDAADASDMEYANPYQQYRRLIEVVTNESLTPELLPYEADVAEAIVDQVQYMNKNLIRLKPKLDVFCVEQHQMELERFAFVLRKYYRTRLEKIEQTSKDLVQRLQGPNGRAEISRLLSPAELKYLDRYVTGIDTHLEKTVLSRLPSLVRSFKLTDIASDEKNEFDCHYVFVKAVVRTNVTVDDPVIGQEVVTMEKGSQHFLPYSAVRNHLRNGSKDLLLL